MKHDTRLGELAREAELHSLRRKKLEQCEKHVVLGEKHISRQREIIDQLDRDGVDAGWARDLLNTLERHQLLHIEHRDYFREVMATIASNS